MSAVPPLMLKTPANPDCLPIEVFDSIKVFSETDCTEDLKKFDVPTLIVYPGAPHGLTDTHKDKLDADLLSVIRG